MTGIQHFALRIRYEPDSAKATQIKNAKKPDEINAIRTSFLTQDLKVFHLGTAIPKKTGVHKSVRGVGALDLLYDSATAHHSVNILKTFLVNARVDQLEQCSMMALELFELPKGRPTHTKWYNKSLVPVLAVYNTPDGQAPCHSSITDPAPAKLSRVSPPSITDSEVKPTSESYPLSSTSSVVPPGPSTSGTVHTLLPRRPSWGSNAMSSIPRRNSYDDDTIALPQAPRHTLRARLSPSKPIFSAAELSPKQSPINEPASSSESHVASWWKSKPKTTSTVIHDGLFDQGESDAPRSGWKPKQSGSNSIPLGSNGPRRAQVDHGSTAVGSASLPQAPSESSYGLSQPPSSASFSPRLLLTTSENSCDYSSPTKLLDEIDSFSPPERLERLRQQVSEQAEEIRGYKRTMELMLDGEKELTEDVKRLKTEREWTLEVLWGMQTEAFPGEDVKPVRDVMSALNSLDQHLRNTQTLLHIEQAERKNVEQLLAEEKEARARDLSAIEKECKDPFVVPALLQAFLKMSKMTDAVL